MTVKRNFFTLIMFLLFTAEIHSAVMKAQLVKNLSRNTENSNKEQRIVQKIQNRNLRSNDSGSHNITIFIIVILMIILIQINPLAASFILVFGGLTKLYENWHKDRNLKQGDQKIFRYLKDSNVNKILKNEQRKLFNFFQENKKDFLTGKLTTEKLTSIAKEYFAQYHNQNSPKIWKSIEQISKKIMKNRKMLEKFAHSFEPPKSNN